LFPKGLTIDASEIALKIACKKPRGCFDLNLIRPETFEVCENELY
jgi:hypothetical protein